MGLDELHLRVLVASSDDTKEKANAKKGMRATCVDKTRLLIRHAQF